MKVQVTEVLGAAELGTTQPWITGASENIFEADHITWSVDTDTGALHLSVVESGNVYVRVASFYRWTKVIVLDHPSAPATNNPPEADPVLDCPMEDNDANAITVRGYLKALLLTLMEEGEGFSGKRPFGNSGWEYDMETALVKAGVASGEGEAGSMILEAIGRL